MPIYNGIEFIYQSINSIKKQSISNWELIIGINGHPPNSEVYQKAKEYENHKIKVIELYPIKGKSEALNNMLKYCTYNWIALLDVDDIWFPKKLESQLPYMTKYDVIGTKCRYFGERGGEPNIPLGDITAFDFIQVNPIINSSCLVRKKLCAWDVTKEGIEDYDMWLRLWKAHKKFYNVESVQIFHRIHQESAFNARGNHLKVTHLRKIYEY